MSRLSRPKRRSFNSDEAPLCHFFGVSKTQNADGELVELTLNISHKYMEQQTTIGPNGVETISAPAMEQIASILLTPANARALRALLDQTHPQPRRVSGLAALALSLK